MASKAYLPFNLSIPTNTETRFEGQVCGLVDLHVDGVWSVELSGYTCGNNESGGMYNMSHVYLGINGNVTTTATGSSTVLVYASLCNSTNSGTVSANVLFDDEGSEECSSKYNQYKILYSPFIIFVNFEKVLLYAVHAVHMPTATIRMNVNVYLAFMEMAKHVKVLQL